jgi:hypothetical protein
MQISFNFRFLNVYEFIFILVNKWNELESQRLTIMEDDEVYIYCNFDHVK